MATFVPRIPQLIRYIFSFFWPARTGPPPDYYPVRRLEKLNERYVVQVKLGSGVWSSTLLVSDVTERKHKRYYAVKVLTRDATNEHRARLMLELESMKTVRDAGPVEHLPTLLDDFEIALPRGGSHICMVMDVYGQDVATFRRSAPQKALPVYTVKKIIKQVLRGTARLHDLGIVHTDIKPDNMLFRTERTPEDIEKWLATLPSDQPDASYPLPPDFHWDDPPARAKDMKIVLTDLGQSQRVAPLGQQTAPLFGAFSLRAPEVILRSDFSPAIDVWAIGCIVFEMLSGRWLFHPEGGGDDWSVEDDHLAKMMELSGEQFSAAMLGRAERAKDFFDSHGNLLKIPELFHVPVENALENYKTVSHDEAKAAASFIQECIHLEPAERPSAAELLQHPWLHDI